MHLGEAFMGVLQEFSVLFFQLFYKLENFQNKTLKGKARLHCCHSRVLSPPALGGGAAHLAGAPSQYRKVAGSIPSLGTYRSQPMNAKMGELVNVFFFFSLSPFLSLKLNNFFFNF